MIVQNAVQCITCGDFIYSAHRHHFNTCSCGAISVDGGQEYLRRVGDMGSAIDLSWSLSDEIYKACAEAVQDAIDTKRNKFGIANAVMRKLRENNRIVADGEPLVIAHNQDQDEIMVQETDGSYTRYKKIAND